MKLRFLLVSLAIVFGGSANIYAQKKKSVVRSLFTGVCSFAFSPSQSKETEKTDVQKNPRLIQQRAIIKKLFPCSQMWM